MALQNLKTLPDAELKAYFDSFETVLTSGDGTLWNHEGAVRGASTVLSLLRDLKKRVILVSNTSSTGLDAVFQETVHMDLGFTRFEIILPSLAVFDYLKDIDFRKELFIIGSPTLKHTFGTAGFTVSNPGPDTYKESIIELSNNVFDNANIGAVIFDFDLNFNYASFLKALTYLQRSEVRYITMDSEKNISIGYDMTILGQRTFQNMLEHLSRKPPVKFGKPSVNMASYIETHFNNEKSKTLYIGDSLVLDMPFASRSKYQNLLVLGETNTVEEAENAIGGSVSIDYYVESLYDLGILINKYKNLKYNNNTST